ncbi:hypothetical protein L8949_41840, partial [Paraburkholderia caribensis]|nr:hypothetical protein [Paraburkholderia caribensis]
MTTHPAVRCRRPARSLERNGNVRIALRRKRAVIDAIGEEALASRVTLLALLGDALAAIEASCTSTMLIARA